LVELAVGFLSVEPTVGRAGGLLRVVPVVVLAGAIDEVFKAEVVEGFGFVVELGIDRFGIDAAFAFGGVGLDSGCCSTISTGSSIVSGQREGSSTRRW